VCEFRIVLLCANGNEAYGKAESHRSRAKENRNTIAISFEHARTGKMLQRKLDGAENLSELITKNKMRSREIVPTD
jgi:hypothetical protein